MKNLLSFRNPSILLAFFLGLSFHFVSFTGNAQTACQLTGQPLTLQDDAIIKGIAEQYDGYLEGIYLIDIDSITQITSLSPDSIQLEVGLEELHESLILKEIQPNLYRGIDSNKKGSFSFFNGDLSFTLFRNDSLLQLKPAPSGIEGLQENTYVLIKKTIEETQTCNINGQFTMGAVVICPPTEPSFE